MTDLSTLLHAEAATINTPPVPATDLIVASGRRMRVQRRVRAGVVAAAVLAVIGAGVALSITAWQSPDRITPAEQAYLSQGAWIDGTKVHVGGHTVDIPDAYRIGYTSVGAVVITRDETGAGAADPLTLVRPDGTTSTIDAPGIEELPGTDPATDNLAYVRPVGDGFEHWELVVLDVSSGDIVATVPYDDKVTTGSGRAPAVDLHGDTVLMSMGEGLEVVDWRSGEHAPVASEGGGIVFASSYGAGAYIVPDTGFGQPVEHWQVRSWTDGELLGEFPGDETAELSPDGRYLKVGGTTTGFTVYDVSSGESTEYPDRGASTYGWGPDGHLVEATGATSPQPILVHGAQNLDQSDG